MSTHPTRETGGSQRLATRSLNPIRRYLNARPRLDFVIVGAEKAGTSALFDTLRRVPGVYGPVNKELNFFDREDRYRDGSDLSALHRWFVLAPKGAILGEATPSYLKNPQSFQRIHDYNPDIKVIAILRSPVVRAFSGWNFRRARLRDKRDFMTAVRVEIETGGDLMAARENKYRYVDTGRYGDQLRKLRQVFAPENLMILKYEDFNRDQDGHTRAVIRFLGGDDEAPLPQPRRVNVWRYNQKLTRDEFLELLPVYEADIRDVEQQLGWDCTDWRTPPR